MTVERIGPVVAHLPPPLMAELDDALRLHLQLRPRRPAPCDDLAGTAQPRDHHTVTHPTASHPVRAWPPQTERVRLAGATLRVATCGQGPPLLLLTGIGANIEMWEPVARRLPGRRLVMPEMPGSGGSPPLLVPRRLGGYADLVVRLLDRLGIGRADVLGYSWGGALAQEFAHRAPDRVGALVLAATTPGLGGQPPAPWVVALMATPARYYSRTYLRLVAPLVFGSAPAPAADSSHGQARRRRPPSLRGYSQQLWAISGWSSRRYLGDLRMPTLVLVGSHDPLIPARNGRILARQVPGARLRVVDGGHLFLLEQPDEGCRAVAEFLDGHGVGSTPQASPASRTHR